MGISIYAECRPPNSNGSKPEYNAEKQLILGAYLKYLLDSEITIIKCRCSQHLGTKAQ
jgi:hypothetical protein